VVLSTDTMLGSPTGLTPGTPIRAGETFTLHAQSLVVLQQAPE
jgi:hypothetical protein